MVSIHTELWKTPQIRGQDWGFVLVNRRDRRFYACFRALSGEGVMAGPFRSRRSALAKARQLATNGGFERVLV
jgi:hypothetical protein